MQVWIATILLCNAMNQSNPLVCIFKEISTIVMLPILIATTVMFDKLEYAFQTGSPVQLKVQ